MFFAQRKHIILEAELAQQGFDNLLYILILINPAVGAFIKEPQPGYNLGLVTIEAPLLKAGVDKALHIAIQVARDATQADIEKSMARLNKINTSNTGESA